MSHKKLVLVALCAGLLPGGAGIAGAVEGRPGVASGAPSGPPVGMAPASPPVPISPGTDIAAAQMSTAPAGFLQGMPDPAPIADEHARTRGFVSKTGLWRVTAQPDGLAAVKSSAGALVGYYNGEFGFVESDVAGDLRSSPALLGQYGSCYEQNVRALSGKTPGVPSSCSVPLARLRPATVARTSG